MSRRFVAAGLALAAAACADIGAPLRSDIYEWRLVPTPGDTVSFHWPEQSLPVRVWVENELDMPANIQRSIEQWRGAFLYHELEAVLVNDSTTADIILLVEEPPLKPVSAVRVATALSPECRGATDLDIPAPYDDLRLPVRSYVHPVAAPGAPAIADCLALTGTHELGHALGIFRHSENPDDIMYFDPTVAAPSEADLTTLEVLYHVRPTTQPVTP